MGAWSTGLFDNDTALDAVGMIRERLGLNTMAPDRDVRAASIDAAMPSLDWGRFEPLDTVVLAAFLMRAGARLPERLREAAKECVAKAASEESYFYEQAQGEVLAALSRYEDGKPWPFAEKSLSQAFAEKAAMGIVNEPPRSLPGGR